MLSEIFKTVLILSVTGSAVISLILLLKPVTEKRFGAVWQYYIWLAAIAVLIFPVKINLPIYCAVETSEKLYEAVGVIEHIRIKTVDLPFPDAVEKIVAFKVSDLAAILWISVALIVILCKMLCYLIFRKNICKNSVYAFSKGRLCIRKSDKISSPLLTGILKPVLIIPFEITDEKVLSHILSHELTHYKRCDILYKWLAVFVKSLHWFNPFVYLLAKEIDNGCEISCDVLLTKAMTTDEKKSYMNTVLSLIEKNASRKFIPFASMASNKDIIKKRFKMIMNFSKIKVSVKLVSLSAALTIGLCGITAGSILLSLPAYAENLIPEKTISFHYERTEDETAAHVNIAEPVQTDIMVEEITPAPSPQPEISPPVEKPDQKLPEIKKNTASDENYVNMEILEFTEKLNSHTMISLVEQTGSSYIHGQFRHEDGTQKFISGISPDENGNITLHLSSDIDEIIQVDFWEDESQKGVWGVKIPADSGRAYSFTGFDTGKKYSLRLYSPAKENWKIDSEYIIY